MNQLKSLEPIARFILPTSVFLKVKRWMKRCLNNRFLRAKSAAEPNKMFSDKAIFEDFHLITRQNNLESSSLVICCAFTGRYEILTQSIAESFNSVYRENIRWFLCGSNKQDCDFITRMQEETNGKVSGIIWRNNPLGEKWQACVSFAKQFYDAELYAITGSDDVLSSKLIDTIIDKHTISINAVTKQLDSKDTIPALYCTDQWTLACLNENDSYSPTFIKCQIRHNGYFIPLGAGRFYSKSFLESVKFNIFDESLNSCLDDYGYLIIKNRGLNVSFYTPEDGLLLSVKGDWAQMNSVGAIVDSTTIKTEESSIHEYKNMLNSLSTLSCVSLFKDDAQYTHFTWDI